LPCNESEISKYIRAVSRQWLYKHVPAATDTHATIKVLFEMVFSTGSGQRSYKEGNLSKNNSVGREPTFTNDLCPEAKD
jgi:hypothetical protein